MTNRHVELADKAITAYTGAPEYEPDDPQAVLTDLLADLMHWAESIEEVNMLAAYKSALGHFDYEVNNPDEETSR